MGSPMSQILCLKTIVESGIVRRFCVAFVNSFKGFVMVVRQRSIAFLLFAALFAATAANSSPILHEGSANFSNVWTSPTVIATGTSGVSGAGAPEWMGGDRLDIFQFSSLQPGAVSIVFDFSLTGPLSPNAYSNGGGAIYVSFVPFSGAYYVDNGDGKVLGSHNLLAGNFNVIHNPWEAASATNRGTSSFTLNLGEGFGGNLFLALDFTYGQVSYNINSLPWAGTGGTADTSLVAAPSSVPLPAMVWMMLAAMLGMFGMHARRRREFA